MTREERLELLKQIEKDIYVPSLESTLLDDAKSCAIHSAIEELEQEPTTKNDLSSELEKNSKKLEKGTTKNNLGVDCIDRQATLDAIIKRLGIKNETYLLEAERTIYQQILAMPPVTPQEPILDKLRAEIKEKIEQEEFARSVFRHEEKDAVKAEQCTGSIMAYNNVIKLIDKYKGESEDSEIKLTNSDWIDFLSEQFDISRTSAKEMLHTMMSVKKEDNFKKQFSGRK